MTVSWSRSRTAIAVAIAVAGVGVTVWSVVRLWPRGPARVVNHAIEAPAVEAVTFDLPTSPDTIETDLTLLNTALRDAAGADEGTEDVRPSDPYGLRRAALEAARLYLAGSAEDLVAYLKSHDLAPLPARLRDDPKALRAVWESQGRALRGMAIATAGIEVRPRSLHGEVFSYSEAMSVTGHRPERVPGVDDADVREGEYEVWEILIPAEMKGITAGHEMRAFQGRLGLWMLRRPADGAWVLYQMRIYDSPSDLFVVIPPM